MSIGEGTAGEETAGEGSRPTAASSDRAPYLSSIIALALGVLLGRSQCPLRSAGLGRRGGVPDRGSGQRRRAADHHDVRQRRVQPVNLRALSKGLLYRPKLRIASALGSAVLLVDTAAGFLVHNLSEGLISLAHGDQSRASWPARW